MSVTLLNGGSQPISDYFLQEDPENVEALLYQWFHLRSPDAVIARGML